MIYDQQAISESLQWFSRW